MKKFLYIFIIFVNTFNMAMSYEITNSLYLPEAGKILSDLKIGYNKTNFKHSLGKKRYSSNWIIQENGKFGLFETLSINYGLDYSLKRRFLDEKMSKEFTKYFFGITNRFVETDLQKLDFVFNVGEEEFIYKIDTKQTFLYFAIKYGFDFDSYVLQFKIDYKYRDTYKNSIDDFYIKNNSYYSFYIKNQYIFNSSFAIDLNLFYRLNEKIRLAFGRDAYNTFTKSYNEKGLDANLSYFINSNNAISLYYIRIYSDMKIENLDSLEYTQNNYKTKISDSIGIRLTSVF